MLTTVEKPGDVTDIPRYGVTPQLDSRFLEDAFFPASKEFDAQLYVPTEMVEAD